MDMSVIENLHIKYLDEKVVAGSTSDFLCNFNVSLLILKILLEFFFFQIWQKYIYLSEMLQIQYCICKRAQEGRQSMKEVDCTQCGASGLWQVLAALRRYLWPVYKYLCCACSALTYPGMVLEFV